MPELRKAGHKELKKYYPLMEMDFDSEELLNRLQMHKELMSGNLEMLILEDDQSHMDLAYMVVAPKSIYGYVLLKYFAVLPWYKESGVGIEAMRALHRKYADKQGIIAEITDFELVYTLTLCLSIMRIAYKHICPRAVTCIIHSNGVKYC